LLVLDMMKGNCGKRPLCVASVPNVKRLYDKARAAKVFIWESNGPENMVSDEFPPLPGDWMNVRGPDKFLNSDLEQKLKAHNIKTVIVCGTSFQGVGIGTGSAAAQRGYNVIVPVDCLSSESLYREQYSAYHLSKGGPGVVTRHTTLTRSTMVSFSK
jgi:nicotinamidase-related amidase